MRVLMSYFHNARAVCQHVLSLPPLCFFELGDKMTHCKVSKFKVNGFLHKRQNFNLGLREYFSLVTFFKKKKSMLKYE